MLSASSFRNWASAFVSVRRVRQAAVVADREDRIRYRADATTKRCYLPETRRARYDSCFELASKTPSASGS